MSIITNPSLSTIINRTCWDIRYYLKDKMKYACSNYTEFLSKDQLDVIEEFNVKVEALRQDSKVILPILFTNHYKEASLAINNNFKRKLKALVRQAYEDEFGYKFFHYIHNEIYLLNTTSSKAVDKRLKELKEEVINKINSFNPFTHTWEE